MKNKGKRGRKKGIREGDREGEELVREVGGRKMCVRKLKTYQSQKRSNWASLSESYNIIHACSIPFVHKYELYFPSIQWIL